LGGFYDYAKLCIAERISQFVGSDLGGERAALLYTLIETAKLNGFDPEACLAHAIGQFARGHLATRLSELLPWNCKDALTAKTA
jgi:transposase